MIRELPIEIQFQIFAILFQSTHTPVEITDLIHPSWFEKGSEVSHESSPMWYTLRLMFLRIVIKIDDQYIFIHNLPSTKYWRCDSRYLLLLKFFESCPATYFKLILTVITPLQSELVSCCVKLATEINCDSSSGHLKFLRKLGCLPKVTNITVLSLSLCLEIVTKIKIVKHVTFCTAYMKSRGDMRRLIAIIEQLPPSVCDKCEVTVYVDITRSKLDFCLSNCPNLIYMRNLFIAGESFNNYCLVDNTLAKCTALKSLTIGRRCKLDSKDYKMKLQNDSLQELKTWGIPFDFSGCPNITSASFSFPELKDYIDSLNELQNSKVRRLKIYDLPYAADR
ncbi:unnamed protein product [Ambrosiozyma monospora]|uniref:Unnamed protein product n=1 Tax=Ambrosiozyma monospora TaxID=43982 RepID=A0ACB5T5L6_AMBMO|nr:unnamed protein product [Ambrosiozyma monospora]